ARAPARGGERPAGSGAARFALFANRDDEAERFAADHHALVERDVRPPFATGSTWLVRPDGYVGVVANAGDWNALESYLAGVAGS
ncbi:MAG: FAD-binding monooxygenase, partial [Candidatus Eremiobacteraeota bacterium]|nr:FAD-binding monooxygenase [Candidatus Eremiobacteraeota bacterium]